MLKEDCSFRRLKRRSKTKNFLSISFSASRRRGGGRRRRKNARKFFGFCTRSPWSRSEAHWFVSPRNRSVRGSFKPPRASRVRSGFAQRLIHHRKNPKSVSGTPEEPPRSGGTFAFPPQNPDSARIRHAPRGSKSTVRSLI